MKKIPSKITIGGQDIEIRNVVRCDGNAVGECHLLEGMLRLQKSSTKTKYRARVVK